VDVIQADTSNDQWRLGTHLWSMTTNVSDTVVTLGSGSSAIDLISGYDATTQRLVMQARSGIFTPNQVQAVLSNLAWVNTSSDSALDQSSREFTVSYKDAFGNMSASTAIVFSVDTHPPTQPSGVTIVPTGGVITTNTLNGTNTSMSFEATIAAGECEWRPGRFLSGEPAHGVGLPILKTMTAASRSVWVHPATQNYSA